MFIKRLCLLSALLVSTTLFTNTTHAEPKKFSLAWSIYVGFMPWQYMDESGIMDKWAKKYGIDVELVQVNDYIEAINLYTAGRFDGATMTNMDMLTIPSAAGVDTTAVIVGDFSNGNDAVVLKNRTRLEDIAGLDVNLLELSVSHYTLARALDTVGLSERDVRVVNTSDVDIANAFLDDSVQAVTLWNPQLETVMQHPEAVKVFDSTQIPGEILDIMGVNSATLAANPELGKAMTGAWFEAVGILLSDTPEGIAARELMAAGSGTDLAGFERQLEATYLFPTPQAKLDYLTSERLTETMDFVTAFSFEHGLLGDGAASADVIGIAMPDGSVLGNPDFVRMRFNHDFLQMAVDNTL
ncbi:putative urea ABC transporter substrate-binding protein [Halopseudomonas salegens]|uniref:NitT/TauT family transport system substrate-binding protein n=1 Tax=Halopseudomonas salegens TaxID=1434072 RepID=A0A1H2E000_9GAMM|nr:putative urea ABC transporter substrate-binding protein [Halopseudomonas salegens]SDT88387.1 NitT/TauT family transport system substrate-binding protein [Halopseudomonas salegens]